MRRPKRGSVWAAGLWLRQWRRRWRTRAQRRDERRARRRLDERTDHRPGWRHRRRVPLAVIATLVTLVLSIALSLVAAVLDVDVGPPGVARWCDRNDFACQQAQAFLKGPLLATLSLLLILVVRQRQLTDWYRRKALGDRRMVLPTTEQDVTDGSIVGRDELCGLMVQRLHDAVDRRPLLLVGGIGTGKTATMLRLSEILTDTGVVVVGIELRSVTEPGKLNFHRLAREQFERIIDTRLRASGEADTVWRQLRQDNRLVVLADGLEEALADSANPCDRDSMIREAVKAAVRDELSLVIASRPDDPLRGLQAMLLQLDPLSEGAALEYVQAQGRRSEAEHRWDTIVGLVKDADVAESPFYLRIIGALYEVRGLDISPPHKGRSWARWALLERWRDALVAGDLYEDYGLPQDERHDAIEVLSALACIGLGNNSLSVRTDELTGGRDRPGRQQIMTELRRRLRKINPDNAQDVGLAETTGGELGIVTKHQDGVRFQHGVVQAYLGARFLSAAMGDSRFLTQAFRCDNGPGRELLAALTLRACDRNGSQEPDIEFLGLPRKGWWRTALTGYRGPQRNPGGPDLTELVHMLCAEAVLTDNRTRALEMFATALEMDAAIDHPAHALLADAVRGAWHHYQGDGSITDRPLEDAKIALVHRFGDAARLLSRGSSHEPRYRQLFEMMADETSYLVRLAAARELGKGGDATARALGDLLDEPSHQPDPDLSEPATLEEERRRDHLLQVRAWLAPSLFLFASDERSRAPSSRHVQARRNLQRWVQRLGTVGPDETPVWELHLAQGFRLAANCRSYPTHRSLLIEEAERALRLARCWYSHLALIQALTLLALPRDPGENLSEQGHGSDPRGLVNHWLSIAGGGPRAPRSGSESPHPFVLEVADHCVQALVDRHPERHCWIDEHEIVGRVGSVSPKPAIRGLQDAWLPPSHGWAVLEPRAQRLLADVMLLLNLAQQGRNDTERSRRLSRSSRPELPPCLTIDRGAMRVTLSRRQAHDVQPGSTCVDDCSFRLCPLPPKGDELPYQMDEAFCAHQIDLVGHWFRPSAPAGWQAVNREDLRRFWREMSQRMTPAWRK